MNSPCSIYSNMNPWLSVFGLFFSVLKSLLGIARQCSRETFAMLTIKCFSETRQGWATFSGKFLLGPKRFLYDSTEISGNRNIIFLTLYFCRPIWPPCHVFASQEYWQVSLWFVKPFFFKRRVQVPWKLVIFSQRWTHFTSFSSYLFLRRNKDLF